MPIKFIHIPRNAGSSIELLGKSIGEGWGQFDEELKERKPFKNLSYWHTPLYEFEPHFLRDYLAKYELFTVVRNPYERLVSEYYFYKCWNKVEIPSAKEMNEYIQNNLKDLNNITHDGHFIPQHKFIMDKNMNLIIKPSNILKFENLIDDFNNLMIKYNINLNINNFKINGSVKELTINDLYPETIEMINKYYYIDFILFGYILL